MCNVYVRNFKFKEPPLDFKASTHKKVFRESYCDKGLSDVVFTQQTYESHVSLLPLESNHSPGCLYQETGTTLAKA